MSTPGTVKRSKLSKIHMVEGGERVHPIVIDRGRVKEWIGFGWIDCGHAEAEERAKYPLVVDNDEDANTAG